MTVTVSNLGAISGTITIPSSTSFQHQGKVIQTVTKIVHTKSTYSAPNSGNGTEVTPLNLVITPTRNDSVIWLRWCVAYEMHHDTGFIVHRDGTLIGYNSDRGNVRYSNILTPLYDNDYSSTPQNSTINWFDRPGDTSEHTYSLRVRSSSGSNYTLALNRTNSSTGADNQETGVTICIAREISG